MKPSAVATALSTILLAVALAGCTAAHSLLGPTEARVAVETDRSAYERGENLHVRIVNRARRGNVSYPACMTPSLEREVEGAWEEPERGPVICTLQLSTLRPGESASREWSAPEEPGRYRVVFVYTATGVDRLYRATSPPFEVR